MKEAIEKILCAWNQNYDEQVVKEAAAAIAEMVQKEQDFRCDICDEEYDREVGELEARLAEMRKRLEWLDLYMDSYLQDSGFDIGRVKMATTVKEKIQQALAAAGKEPQDAE